MSIRKVLDRLVMLMQVFNLHLVLLAIASGDRRSTAFCFGIFVAFAVFYGRMTLGTMFTVVCFYLRLVVYAGRAGILLGAFVLANGAYHADKLAIRDGYIILAMSCVLSLVGNIVLGFILSLRTSPGLPERREQSIALTPGGHFRDALKAEYEREHR